MSKFYRCNGQAPCTLPELLASSAMFADTEEDLERLEFGQCIDLCAFAGGRATRKARVVCVGTVREMRLLEVLEANDSRCMDSSEDRLVLARALSEFMRLYDPEHGAPIENGDPVTLDRERAHYRAELARVQGQLNELRTALADLLKQRHDGERRPVE